MSFVKNNTFKLTFPTHLKKAMGNIKCHTLVYVSSTSIKVVLQNPIICLTADVYFMTPVTNEIWLFYTTHIFPRCFHTKIVSWRIKNLKLLFWHMKRSAIQTCNLWGIIFVLTSVIMVTHIVWPCCVKCDTTFQIWSYNVQESFKCCLTSIKIHFTSWGVPFVNVL